MQVTLQYAAQHLAELADAVDHRQDVEIVRPGKPTLMLMLSTTPATERITSRII